MKKLLIVLGVLGVLAILPFILIQIHQYVLAATTNGDEPSKEVITAIKNCTKGQYKNKSQFSYIQEYNIKGLLPNGRCEFVVTSYTDFTDKKAYENAQIVMGGFTDMAVSMAKDQGKSVPKDALKLPTQAEMIKMTEENKDVMTCKLSKKERDDLYSAWALHDDKNPLPKLDKNGHLQSFSFDSSKMSSYSNLMMTYSQGPCEDKNGSIEFGDEKPKSIKKYACEYSDATCYITIYELKDGDSSSMSCIGDDEKDTFGLMEKVKQHAKAGMCSLI